MITKTRASRLRNLGRLAMGLKKIMTVKMKAFRLVGCLNGKMSKYYWTSLSLKRT